MAQHTVVTLLDDLDGGEAAQTVSFAVDGTAYDIDLSTANAEAFQTPVAPYVSGARRAGRPPAGTSGAGRRRSGAAPARTDREQNAAVRDWASAQGIKVSARGRIPADVLDRYQTEAGRKPAFSG